jgi:Ca2+-binding EF-hand superfamily protein
MAALLFDSYDADNSGFLDVKEFKKCLKEVLHEISKTFSVEDKKLNQQFTINDTNGDNKISRKEFVKTIENFVNSHMN